MKLKTILRSLPVLASGLAAGQSHAAGFQLLEQNASGLGNAYAGSAVVADNASTIFFNPAGMTQLKDREASLGLSLVKPSFQFSNQGSNAGFLGSSGNGDNAGSLALLPNGYLSWRLRPDLTLGVGLGAPFGLVTEYNNPWVGAAQALKFDIKTYNINPSLAFKVNDALSLGFGLNWQRMEAEYKRVAAVASAALAATSVTLSADSDAWGWNAGLRWAVSPDTALGLSYRSAISHKLTGSLDVTGAAAGANAALTSGDARTEVKLPANAIFSAKHALSPTVELLGDLSWTGWSSIQRVDIVRTSGALTGATVQTLDTVFRDTWRLALGGNIKLSDMATLKLGTAFDQSPVRNAQTRLVSLPDANRLWFTTGVQYRLDADRKLDLGLAYIRAPKTPIDNDQFAAGRGRVTGNYDASVFILGAQYSMAF